MSQNSSCASIGQSQASKLTVSDPSWLDVILRMSPQLEALRIHNNYSRQFEYNLKLLPVPWATLREIEIRGILTFSDILYNFTVSLCPCTMTRCSADPTFFDSLGSETFLQPPHLYQRSLLRPG